MPRVLLPVLAIALLPLLSGCGAGFLDGLTPSPSGSATEVETESPSPDPEPVLDPLPAGAFLRITVTAVSTDGSELDIVLTVDAPQAGAAAGRGLDDLTAACPNAVAAQLDIFSALEPTGVITATVVATGDWQPGDRATLAAGPLVVNIGAGDALAPTRDPATGFGCTAAILTGPGEARLTSLLLGDPAIDDQVDADTELRHGVYGVEPDADSASELTWKHCRVQLSERAQLIVDQTGWDLPEDRGSGCLIGYGGSA